ncbi:hypothetical protein SH1V18_26630 [Vallitalea longa]|uniref:Uncharacterized protein n=1 Tax=Vallitalea longa TaxID=2936439 RepID=A0A9W6DG78_9FIRM|nr:hypothetical protein [Vallitalea longa]GKX30183.1 hypothetical protein SH1V18_26630 [Vallitalea longa]
MSDLKFSDFLETIDDQNKDFVIEINTFLLKKGCKHNIKLAKRGYTVSYIFGTNKRTLATFICRKSGVKLRIYPQHLCEYEDLLNSFPDNIKKDIKKASVCKRLIDPDACNPKCIMGYDFHLDNEHYQKCRYMAFQPTLNKETNSYIKLFLEKEIACF